MQAAEQQQTGCKTGTDNLEGIIRNQDRSHLTFAALPGTNAELMARTGLAKRTVMGHLIQFRKDNLCHTGGWVRQEGPIERYLAIYVRGPGIDAVYVPAGITDVEKQRRYREKIKNTDKAELRKEKNRILHRAALVRKQAKRAQIKLWAAPLFSDKPREYF